VEPRAAESDRRNRSFEIFKGPALNRTQNHLSWGAIFQPTEHRSIRFFMYPSQTTRHYFFQRKTQKWNVVVRHEISEVQLSQIKCPRCENRTKIMNCWAVSTKVHTTCLIKSPDGIGATEEALLICSVCRFGSS